jgi:hypothetical protein
MKYKVYAIGDFKELYRAANTHDPNAPVSKYTDIMNDLFVEIQKMIIQDTQHYKLPYACGYVQIIAIHNKGAVGYSKTGEVKKIRNLHTNGVIYKFKWYRGGNTRFFNSRYYKYTPPLDYKYKETGKRGLAKWIKECADDPKKRDFIPYKTTL